MKLDWFAVRRRLTPRERQEKRKEQWKDFFVKFGVWLALAIGVAADQVFPGLDFKAGKMDVTMKPLYFQNILASLVVALILYAWMERKGEFEGKRKNVGRLIRSAFFLGFFCMEVLGRIKF